MVREICSMTQPTPFAEAEMIDEEERGKMRKGNIGYLLCPQRQIDLTVD